MKKSIFLSGHLFLMLMTIMLITSSCSLLSTDRESISRDSQDASSSVVSRDQFEQLKKKYQEVSQKYEELKSQHEPPVETVDVFDNLDKNTVRKSQQGAARVESLSSRQTSKEEQIEEDVLLYNRALNLKSRNELQKALKAFQILSRSDVFQVRVRAKYQLGRIFMDNQEHDLAMQMFEEIIHNYASSGVVVQSLRSLVECSRKLDLQEKERKYSAILKDIFGQS